MRVFSSLPAHPMERLIEIAALSFRLQNTPDRAGELKRPPDYLLVHKVADVGKDALTQFHAQQPCTDGGAQLTFKPFEGGSRPVRPNPTDSETQQIPVVLDIPG